MRLMLATLATLTTLSGCSNGPTAPSYAQVQAIYTRSCAVADTSCHSATGQAAGGLHLNVGESYAATVRAPSTEIMMAMIEPGHSDRSFLYHKIVGDMYTPGVIPACTTSTMNCGVRMPMLAGVAITAGDIQVIADWINGGAPGPDGGM